MPALVAAASFIAPTPASASPTTHVYVSPAGDDASPGTRGRPFATPQKARDAVRALNDDMRGDIVVTLTAGIYRVANPLVLTSEDSGTNGHKVIWQADRKAHPVISGGRPVTGWQQADASKNIWSAPVPADAATRQLYVDGKMAPRARTAINRDDLKITPDGYTIANSRAAWLLRLPGIDKAEIRGINSFTDRYSPIQSVDGDLIRMEQPAWRNNTFGWDHLGAPFHEGGFYVENALALLDEPGEWYLDEAAKKMFYKPLDGQDVRKADVELPRLESLLQIGGTYDAPARDITFEGIQFSHTTWRLPSTRYGYTDQQTGAFIGDDTVYPEFEASRPHWHQMPAAVQVSAAQNITLTRNTYSDLGSVGVGVGNDANAHASGVGLGTQRIAIRDSAFTQIAGNGITVGGIQADAHHPSDPRMIVKDIDISGNLVHDVAKTYTAGVAILTTYPENAVISHNEVHTLPYSGINAGYGWGTNDAGGSPEYVRRGLYKYQPKYATPTTLKNNRIVGNLVHDIMRMHTDGGAFYNLSANPGTVWERNYTYGNPFYGVYADEGTRFGTFRDNVFEQLNSIQWLTENQGPHLTGNNTVTGNWTNSTNTNAVNGQRGDVVTGNVYVPSKEWPLAAYKVIYEAGLPVERRGEPGVSHPSSGHLAVTAAPLTDGTMTVTATITNVGQARLRNLDLLIQTDDGSKVERLQRAEHSVPGGTSTKGVWKLRNSAASNGSPITSRTISVKATFRDESQERELTAGGTYLTGSAVTSPWVTFGSVPATFGQSADRLAIAAAGADVWGFGGQHDDEYGTIYQKDAIDADGDVTTRVDRQDESNPWTKSGVVVRDDLTGARTSLGYAAVVVTPSNGVVFARDTDGDGLLDAQSQQPGVKAPVWLKLSRTGDQVAGYYSTNGTTWIQIGAAAPLAGGEQLLDAGVLHTSHDVGKPGLAEFSGMKITP
ncbi:hypothetical protein AB0F17_22190 [Nonomuraea sp. NPDC026600]|uniref:hypothetical protein n=1 Tax=Nonomuraea sp. NPDC026600 TaxID=3155363 RepID=UPI0033D34158